MIDTGMKDYGFTFGHSKYASLNETQKAVIAFGMTPVEVIAESREHLKSIIKEPLPDDYREYELGVVLGLMQAARERGKMIC